MKLLTDYSFRPGDVIRHRRYGYRGVVASADSECTASDAWYQSNQTRPDRHQPWYQILADGGSETYVAEENLELDTSGEEINHPLVPLRFPTFLDGRYYGNGLN